MKNEPLGKKIHSGYRVELFGGWRIWIM